MLENMLGLNPCDRFSKFDIPKIVANSKMYTDDNTMKKKGVLMLILRSFITLEKVIKFQN